MHLIIQHFNTRSQYEVIYNIKETLNMIVSAVGSTKIILLKKFKTIYTLFHPFCELIRFTGVFMSDVKSLIVTVYNIILVFAVITPTHY